MGVILLIRQGVLGATTLFSVIVMAISGHLISQTQQYFGLTVNFCSLGIAVAVISLVTLPVMLVVDFLRRGAFTSMIVVELAWFYILCILWVAAAGETASGYDRYFPFGCGLEGDGAIYNGMCQETQAIEAFSFLNFIIILLYAIFLSVMAVIAATRGQGVWLSSVKELFGSSGGPMQYPMTGHNTSMPPQAQVAHPTGAPIHGQYMTGPTQPDISYSGSAIVV